MALWCPEAIPLVRAVLPDHRLVFRPWADIAPRPSEAVPGALYEIGPRCLVSLDAFEEYPTLYGRTCVRVHTAGWCFDAMAYRMPEGRPEAPPDPDYLNLLRRGYEDWGLNQSPLRRVAARRPDDGLPYEGPFDDWPPSHLTGWA
jgi:hypothetical protein